VLITCEHAGKKVPAEFRALFRDQDVLLDTHRGWDPGALILAREMAAAFKAPLFYSETTRLLIDLNRSIGNRDLYSEFSRPLPGARAARSSSATIGLITSRSRSGCATRSRPATGDPHCVAQLHPELNGHVRTADIGFLYDRAGLARSRCRTTGSTRCG
jgi:predicted N-formylglutamate amidohydrolase